MGYKDREPKLTQKDLKFMIGGLRTLTGNIDPSSGRQTLANTVAILQEELEGGTYPDGKIKLPFFQGRRLARIAADQELLQLKKRQNEERKVQIAARTYELKPGDQTTVDDHGWSAFVPSDIGKLFPLSNNIESIHPLSSPDGKKTFLPIHTLQPKGSYGIYGSSMSLIYDGNSFEEGNLLLQIWKSAEKNSSDTLEEVQRWILPEYRNINSRTSYLAFSGKSPSLAYMKLQLFPTNHKPTNVTITTLVTESK